MPVQTPAPDTRQTALAIRREYFDYRAKKPNRIPPADSPNRPHLARLWAAAFAASIKRRNLKTFTHCGQRYGVIFVGFLLCVMDLQTRNVLVKPPTSMQALHVVLDI